MTPKSRANVMPSTNIRHGCIAPTTATTTAEKHRRNHRGGLISAFFQRIGFRFPALLRSVFALWLENSGKVSFINCPNGIRNFASVSGIFTGN